MRVLDLFSGAGGWSRAFVDRGHDVVTIDNEPYFRPTLCMDVRDLRAKHLKGPWDVILASPPCEGFSVAAIRWNFRGGVPYGWRVKQGIELVKWTLAIIKYCDPTFFVIENPVGMLNKLQLIPYEVRKVTMCQYGSVRQKPTHLWGGFPPSLELKPPCVRGSSCHRAQPRGAYTATAIQRLPQYLRGQIPELLSRAVCEAAERDLPAIQKS